MDFSLTTGQQALQQRVRQFVQSEMPKALVAQWDKGSVFPRDLLGKMADAGLTRTTIPERHGGSGGGVMEEVILLAEIANHSSTVALAFGMDICFGAVTIERHGSEAQRDELLPRIADGSCHVCLSLTERAGGTDILSAIGVTARAAGADFVIEGSKFYTTGVDFASHIFVLARTASKEGHLSFGLTLFLVPRDTAGISYREIPKLGSNFLPTYEVTYEQVRVPRACIIGLPDRGWLPVVDTLNNERIFASAVCNGLSRGAYEDALAYARERHAFGRPIGQFQAVQHPLADSLVELELAQLATYKAAWMQDRKMDSSVQAASAKYFASETALRIVDRGMRIMAGHGFEAETHMQRYYRDVRQLILAPVTNEMTRNFIGQAGCGLPKSY